MITQENIDYHFFSNPDWKRKFLEHYPGYTPESYIDNAWELLQRNGYRIEYERLSANPDSQYHDTVRADIYGPIDPDDQENTDGFIVGTGWVRIEDHVQTLVIWCVCDFLIDIKELK